MVPYANSQKNLEGGTSHGSIFGFFSKSPGMEKTKQNGEDLSKDVLEIIMEFQKNEQNIDARNYCGFLNINIMALRKSLLGFFAGNGI